MPAFDLAQTPVHLGLGATAEVLPPFDGSFGWFSRYAEAHQSDGAEGRLVSLFTFSSDWQTWEMHPKGAELVVVLSGRMTLVQKVNGQEQETLLEPGQAAINPPGVWHTARVREPTQALFITAGQGTENAPEPP